MLTDETVDSDPGPIVERMGLADGAHVRSLRSRSGERFELPRGVLDGTDALVIDSLPRLDDHGDGFLDAHHRRVGLGAVAGVEVYPRPAETSVFLPVGLAGTDVGPADACL